MDVWHIKETPHVPRWETNRSMRRDEIKSEYRILENSAEIFKIIEYCAQEVELIPEVQQQLVDSLIAIKLYLEKPDVDGQQIVSEIDQEVPKNIEHIFRNLNYSPIIEICLEIFGLLLEKVNYFLNDNLAFLLLIEILVSRTDSNYHKIVQYIVSNSMRFKEFVYQKEPNEWYSFYESFNNPKYSSLFLHELTNYYEFIPGNLKLMIFDQTMYFIDMCLNEIPERNYLFISSFSVLSNLMKWAKTQDQGIKSELERYIENSINETFQFFNENPLNLGFLLNYYGSLLEANMCVKLLANNECVGGLIERLNFDDDDKEERAGKIFQYFAILAKYYDFSEIQEIIEIIDQFQFEAKCAAMQFIAVYCRERENLQNFDYHLFMVLIEMITIPAYDIMKDLLNIFDLLLSENSCFSYWIHNQCEDKDQLEISLNEISENMSEEEEILEYIDNIQHELMLSRPKTQKEMYDED